MSNPSEFPSNPTDADRGQWTSASNAQADALCKARHLAQRGIPDTDSKDSEFGTKVHQYLAGVPVQLTAEEESVAESCLEIERKMIAKYFGEGTKIVGVRERRFWVQWPDGLRHSGQVDRFYRAGAKGMIVEFKSLPGDVPSSPRNLQLRDQVSLVDANVPLLSEIATVVVQPLVTHSPELCIYTKEDITRARNEMYYRVADSNKEGQPATAGEVQCKHCKAKHNCKAYAAMASSVVKMDKSIVDVPVADWTPEQRKQFCDSFDIAQKWLNNAWAAMEKGAAQDPNFVPGYQMQDGKPRSTIINLQAVFDRFSSAGGTLESFMKCATITKKDLTELVRGATKLKGKKLDDAVDTIIANDLKTSEVKKSLVKI